MTKDEYHIGDGPWTVVLLRDRQPAILSGLDRYPVVGDRFVVDGIRRVQVHQECTMESLGYSTSSSSSNA